MFRIGLRHTFDSCGMKKRSNKTTMYIMDYTSSNGEFKQMGWSRCNRLMFDYFIRFFEILAIGTTFFIDRSFVMVNKFNIVAFCICY